MRKEKYQVRKRTSWNIVKHDISSDIIRGVRVIARE